MMLFLGLVLCLGIVVFVHEMGHYLAARLFGIRILAFSFGFGPVLLQRRDRRGCDWSISALPLGGYVRMLNEEDREENEGKGEKYSEQEYRQAFDRKPAWQKLIIVAAGPLINIVFAAFVYFGCALVPTMEPATTVAQPAANTQASQAGVQAGWKVLAVNDAPVVSFNQMRWLLTAATGERSVELLFEQNNGVRRHVAFDLSAFSMDDEGDRARQLGLEMRPVQVVVSDVLKDSAAQKSGLERADRILTVNGKEISTSQALVDMIRNAAGTTITLTVENMQANAPVRTVHLTVPGIVENGQTVGRVGVMIGMIPELVSVRRGILDAAGTGIRNTWEILWLNVKGIAELVTGKQSLNSLAGPVGIADFAGQALAKGPYVFAMFLAMVSAVLGFTNLLPIPVLDGGYAAVFIWEMASGRAVSRKTMLKAQKVGLVLLLLIFIVATGNDLSRLFGLH